MRRRRIKTEVALLFGVGLSIIVSILAFADVSLTMEAEPVGRGEVLTYVGEIANGGADTLDSASLYVPLPSGLDQWGAEYRLGGGDWTAYPANGLIPLDPIPAGQGIAFEIHVLVEWTAAGSIHTVAQVLDASGVLASQEVTVNVLPSVDAGPDVLVELGDTVTLSDASAEDGGGGIVSYSWSDGGAGGAFDDPSILNPTYTPPPASGLIDLTLTVTDEDGGEASDSLRLCVDVPPAIEIGGEITVDEGESILLDDVEVTDPDGWIVSYAWSDGGAVGGFLPSPDELHPTYVVPVLSGCEDIDIVLTLTVTDNWGAETEGSFTVHVRNQNLPPQVDAGEDRSVEVGEEVVLSGDVFDDDIVSVHWEETSGPPVDLEGAAATTLRFEAPSVDRPTEMTFRLSAIDGCGQEGSDEVVITISPVTEEGSAARSGLAVGLAAFDPRGLPLSPFSPLMIGDRIIFTVTVTNLSDQPLFGLRASSGGEEVPFSVSQLAPWGMASASFTRVVGPGDIAGPFEVKVDAAARTPDDGTASGSDSFTFFPHARKADLTLTETVDRIEAGVGETIIYSFKVTNDGELPVADLSLVDDLIGRIDLPASTIDPGGSIAVSAAYTVKESDLPGPLVDSAILTGFIPEGTVTARASASVAIFPPGGGGGGASENAALHVVISEIAWAGTPADLHDQWIELLNPTGEPVDLSGWKIRFYEKTDPPPDEGEWATIPLSGTIDPLPFSIVDRPYGLAKLAVVKGESGWRLFDLSWWGAGKSDDGGRGYYLIEWKSDRTVSDVEADFVFDGPSLPEAGAVILLVDPQGKIVDSANLGGAWQSGWPAGDPQTCATMERIDPLRGDLPGNWQTSPGILVYGLDADRHLLQATAGKPNSPPLDRLIDFAGSKVTPQIVEPGQTFPISSQAADRPWIRITTTPGDFAGGGGSLTGEGAFSTRRSGGGIELEVDPDLLSDGIYFVWATSKEGEAYLLLLQGEG